MPAAIAGDMRSVLCIRTEVVPDCIEGNHEAVVLDLLGERIGEPAKAPAVHSEG